MGDHVHDELADHEAASSATGPVNALYDRPAVLELLGDVRGRRVLELGCAAGHLTRLLVAAGADVVAVDRSERMVAHARRLVGGDARFEVADLAGGLPMVADASVDLVSVSLVLHYLPDWRGVMAEVHRVLRPGGATPLTGGQTPTGIGAPVRAAGRRWVPSASTRKVSP
jgi:SAM-dependent methyltransferase